MTLTEQVFTKMGYYTMKDDGGKPYCWLNAEGKNDIGIMTPDNDGWCNRLPPIDSQWEVTAKYLVLFMREKGYHYEIEDCEDGPIFNWTDTNHGVNFGTIIGIQTIFNHNIAKAACQAFMEVEL